MSRTVKLTSEEHRQWSQNIPQLVDAKGTPISALAPEIEEACTKVMAHARAQEKSVRAEPVIKSVDDQGRPYNRKLTIEVKCTRTGPERGMIKLHCFVEGHLRVTTRQIMIARLFKKHGECIIQRVNGKFLTKIRDPNKKITTLGPAVPGQRHAPKPEECQCAGWGNREAGKHHPVCQYNQYAPLDERGAQPGEDSMGHVSRKVNLPPGANRPVKVDSPAVPLKEPIAPADCECKDWKGSKEGHHHNICPEKIKWLQRHKPTFYLVSLDSPKEIVREALPQEADAAEIAKKKTGSPMITIDEGLYLVLSDKELPKKSVPKPEVKEVSEPEVENVLTQEQLDIINSSDEEESPQPLQSDGSLGDVVTFGSESPEEIILREKKQEALDNQNDADGLPLPGL